MLSIQQEDKLNQSNSQISAHNIDPTNDTSHTHISKIIDVTPVSAELNRKQNKSESIGKQKPISFN